MWCLAAVALAARPDREADEVAAAVAPAPVPAVEKLKDEPVLTELATMIPPSVSKGVQSIEGRAAIAAEVARNKAKAMTRNAVPVEPAAVSPRSSMDVASPKIPPLAIAGVAAQTAWISYLLIDGVGTGMSVDGLGAAVASALGPLGGLIGL